MSDSGIPPMKKWMMRQYWRMQQSQSIISLIFWATTLSLLIFERLEASNPQWGRADSVMIGLPTAWVVMGSLFIGVGLGVLTVGWLYDRVFSLWTAQRSVDFERNPFWTYALAPVFMMNMALNAENLKRSSDDEKMIEQMDWILNWCKHNAQTEIFARSVQNWDRELGETPTFWFLDENTMSKARAKTIEDDS
jgi:hypothetical protein